MTEIDKSAINELKQRVKQKLDETELYTFKGTVSKEKRRVTNTYRLSKSGTKNAKIFFKYLYTNATVYLERKYNKFLEYFTDRNINIEDVQRA